MRALLPLTSSLLFGNSGISVLGRRFFETKTMGTAATATNDDAAVVNVLGLHGSGGTASAIRTLLEKWSDALDQVRFQVDTVQGEVAKEEGFAWWRLGPGERSSTVLSYDGFGTSESTVLGRVEACNLVIAHSQGAILTTALIALGRLGESNSHPKMGYILNGVAWPNPYTRELETLKVAGNPRVLLIVGVNDKINAPEQAFRVEEALKDAGCSVSTVLHPGGHSVPMPQHCEAEIWEKIEIWIKAGLDER